MSAYRFRPVTADDLDQLARNVYEGMASYREFAPEGWQPPAFEQEREWARVRMLDPRAWTLVGENADGEIAGHVAFMPATMARANVSDATLAHLYHMFVRPPHWGSGLATTLIRRAVAGAAAAGYVSMRLFTPAGQARARRFYEREGWLQSTEPAFDIALGLELVEYRIGL